MVVGYKGKFIGAKRLNVRLFSEFLRTKELPISNTSRNAPSVEKKAILFSVPRVPRRSTWTVTSRRCVTCQGICRRHGERIVLMTNMTTVMVMTIHMMRMVIHKWPSVQNQS